MGGPNTCSSIDNVLDQLGQHFHLVLQRLHLAVQAGILLQQFRTTGEFHLNKKKTKRNNCIHSVSILTFDWTEDNTFIKQCDKNVNKKIETYFKNY